MWSDNYREYSSDEEEIIISETDSNTDIDIESYEDFSDDDFIENEINFNMDIIVHNNEELNDGYYIGVVDNMTLTNYITPSLFYNYPFDRVRNYLINWSVIRLTNTNVEIMLLNKTLCNVNGTLFTYYSVTLKTRYLKIVQKAWKRVLEYRKELYKKRLRYNSLMHREIHGKWPEGLNNCPSLKGCINYPSVLDMEILYKY